MNSFGNKNFWPKKSCGKKNFRLKIFYQKIWVKIVGQKSLVERKVLVEKFL